MHHPPDDLLAAYASGSTDGGESMLVATHLALCPRCRSWLPPLEALGGALLTGVSPIEPEPSALDAVLARLSEPDEGPIDLPPPAANDVPMPLRGHTGPLASVPFRFAGPGVRRFDLPHLGRPGQAVALLSLRPGLRVPPHRHEALERGLVLTGGFTDDHGHFVRGDVSIRSPDDGEAVHDQRVDDGERCVVLMVDDGPKVPVTWLGHVALRLFG